MSGYRNTSGLSNDLSNNELEYNNIINGLNSNYEIGYILLMKAGGIYSGFLYIPKCCYWNFFVLFILGYTKVGAKSSLCYCFV